MAGGIVEVVDGQRADDLAEGHAEVGELGGVDVHVDFALSSAENIGLREPPELRQAALDLVLHHIVGQFRRKARGHGDGHERFGVDVDLFRHRLFCVFRKLRGDGLDAVRDVEHGLRDVDVVLELRHNEGSSLDGVALDLLDSLHLRDGVLDRFAHERFDLGRAGAFVDGADDDDRNIDLRNERDAEAQVAVYSDNHGKQNGHGREDRTPDE